MIEAENYHALQALTYTHAGKVDCIYIDPPYNSGATDWKYNNDYVDGDDSHRHSKWLSMMERRLQVAKVLLKPDGVLIVTIDENEVHNLGALLAQTFPQALHQMVTIVTNPGGSQRDNQFSRVEEYALFVFSGNATVSMLYDDLLAETSKPPSATMPLIRSGKGKFATDRMNLSYGIAILPCDTGPWAPGRVIGTSCSLGELAAREVLDKKDVEKNDFNVEAHKDHWRPSDDELRENGDQFGIVLTDHDIARVDWVWPELNGGRMGRWRVEPQELVRRNAHRHVHVTRSERSGRWAVSDLKKSIKDRLDVDDPNVCVIGDSKEGPLRISVKSKLQRPMTVWHRSGRHQAGGLHGTQMLTELLVADNRFDFPKSLYATLDAVDAVVHNSGSAVVLDYFAGSGTTLHAIAALNAADGGCRQCILVTNNEVSGREATELRAANHAQGDEEWERKGIFHHVTQPRVEASITGERPDGTPVKGQYLPPLYERPLAAGLPAAVEFLQLRCFDPLGPGNTELLGTVLPMLWAKSGGYGACPTADALASAGITQLSEVEWLAPGRQRPDASSDTSVIDAAARYAVLLDDSRSSLDTLEDAVASDAMQHVTHVWADCQSEGLLESIRRRLSQATDGRVTTARLFHDLDEHFRRPLPQ